MLIGANKEKFSTYDHRQRGTGHPVRSGKLKPLIGRAVVESVTIRECLLLYVFLLNFWFALDIFLVLLVFVVIF
jgi:hypothetical protein